MNWTMLLLTTINWWLRPFCFISYSICGNPFPSHFQDQNSNDSQILPERHPFCWWDVTISFNFLHFSFILPNLICHDEWQNILQLRQMENCHLWYQMGLHYHRQILCVIWGFSWTHNSYLRSRKQSWTGGPLYNSGICINDAHSWTNNPF